MPPLLGRLRQEEEAAWSEDPHALVQASQLLVPRRQVDDHARGYDRVEGRVLEVEGLDVADAELQPPATPRQRPAPRLRVLDHLGDVVDADDCAPSAA